MNQKEEIEALRSEVNELKDQIEKLAAAVDLEWLRNDSKGAYNYFTTYPNG